MVLARRVTLAPIAAVLLALAAVSPAFAFDLSPECGLVIDSFTETGAPLDSAAPGVGGTQDDPLVIDWDGSVFYAGNTGSQVIMNHSWQIDVFLVPTPIRGSDPNEDGDQDAEETIDVSDNAPFKFAGLYYVSGAISGDGGSCPGSGWLKLDENPLETIWFWLAALLTVAGGMLVGLSRPTWGPDSVTVRHPIRALIGGLLLGFGLALALIQLSLVPFGAVTVLVVLAGGLLLGLVVSLLWPGPTAPARGAAAAA